MAAAARREERLRVLVVDDHDVVHWGFRVLLGEQPWVERCLAARTGAEAIALTETFKPHVALVDLFLAGESGADLCESIRAASPSTRVVLISAPAECPRQRPVRRAHRGLSQRTGMHTMSPRLCAWSEWGSQCSRRSPTSRRDC